MDPTPLQLAGFNRARQNGGNLRISCGLDQGCCATEQDLEMFLHSQLLVGPAGRCGWKGFVFSQGFCALSWGSGLGRPVFEQNKMCSPARRG